MATVTRRRKTRVKRDTRPFLPRETYRRLEALANILDIVPQEQFDMGAWKCGTQACAAGWGATCGLFPELSFVKSGCPQEYSLEDDAGLTIDKDCCRAMPGLSREDRHAIFLPPDFWDPEVWTPKGKASQIRQILKKYRKERI